MNKTNEGCKGKDCGTLVADHSPECILEAAETQGWLDAPEAVEAAKVISQRYGFGRKGFDYANREVFMTLIKSTDGSAWVEARVGDEITCHIGRTKIASFDKDDEEWIVTTDGLYVEPVECQLIERPFQPDDIVQSKAGSADFLVIGIQPESASIKATARVMHRGSVYDWPLDMLRHSSPLIRPVGGV